MHEEEWEEIMEDESSSVEEILNSEMYKRLYDALKYIEENVPYAKRKHPVFIGIDDTGFNSNIWANGDGNHLSKALLPRDMLPSNFKYKFMVWLREQDKQSLTYTGIDFSMAGEGYVKLKKGE